MRDLLLALALGVLAWLLLYAVLHLLVGTFAAAQPTATPTPHAWHVRLGRWLAAEQDTLPDLIVLKNQAMASNERLAHQLEQAVDANAICNHRLEDSLADLDQCRTLTAYCDTDARRDERRLMQLEHR